MRRVGGRSEGSTPASGWAVFLAVVLASVNLRTAVTSVGPVITDLQRDLAMPAAVAGLLTTLPVLCFAALGSLTPAMARRVGPHRLLTIALAAMVAGLVLRATSASTAMFLMWSVVALGGGAVGNVLLPSLVKRHFPQRVGPMTATYTTAIAVGVTIPAAVTVPIAGLAGGPEHGGWRLGIGSWAVLAALALPAWLPMLREDRDVRRVRRYARDTPVSAGTTSHSAGEGHVSPLALRRNRLAWALTLFFAAQSLQAYVAFGWFAQFFRQAGLSATTAGILVGVLAALAIPVSAVLPTVAARLRTQRPIIAVVTGCYVAGYLGMLVAPREGAWVWVVLVGTGAGAFPLALTMIALRTRTTPMTAALSAFTQSIGYLLAGTGPLLVGVLLGATGSWTWPFVLLFAVLVVMAVAGWVVAGGGHVEDGVLVTPAGSTSGHQPGTAR